VKVVIRAVGHSWVTRPLFPSLSPLAHFTFSVLRAQSTVLLLLWTLSKVESFQFG